MLRVQNEIAEIVMDIPIFVLIEINLKQIFIGQMRGRPFIPVSSINAAVVEIWRLRCNMQILA